VLFFPNAQGRITSPAGRENSPLGFLICHQGKWGLLAVKKGISAENVAENMIPNDERSRLFQSFKSQGIQLIADYDVAECLEDSDRIVQDFLDHLSNA
jgi:signal transduction histidine kinase